MCIRDSLAAPAAEAFQRIDAAWKLRPADPELNLSLIHIYALYALRDGTPS